MILSTFSDWYAIEIREREKKMKGSFVSELR
jgi:hypothetical protein